MRRTSRLFITALLSAAASACAGSGDGGAQGRRGAPGGDAPRAAASPAEAAAGASSTSPAAALAAAAAPAAGSPGRPASAASPAAARPPLLAAEEDWLQVTVSSARRTSSVRVAAGGGVLVTVRQPGSETQLGGALGPARLEELRRALARVDPRALAPGRARGLPGEARLIVTGSAAGRRFEVRLWDSERWEREEVKALAGPLFTIAAEVAGGVVLF